MLPDVIVDERGRIAFLIEGGTAKVRKISDRQTFQHLSRCIPGSSIQCVNVTVGIFVNEHMHASRQQQQSLLEARV